MGNVVNIESLQRENKTYQEGLRVLPAYLLQEYIAKMHLNLIEVDNKDVILNVRRRGALMKPYIGDGTDAASESEAMKLVESILSVDKCYVGLKDNINNYKEKKILAAAGNKVDNKTKKHPLERQILMNAVKTFTEDFIVCFPHAERDATGTTPIDSFDGVYTKLLALIAASEVSTAKGNLIETDAFVAPDGDYNALTKMVSFCRSFDPMLKNGPIDLWIPQGVLTMVRDALAVKAQYIKFITNDMLAEYLRDNCDLRFTPYLAVDPTLGTGQRIMAVRPGIISAGINTRSDNEFVQVRAPYEDPNIAQFWIQGDFGSRIDDWDKKVFACNDQASVANTALMGDYVPS